MSDEASLPNAEIGRRFETYGKLKYKPLGVYFSENLPKGTIRRQHTILNRCIPVHALKAAYSGKISIISAEQGCLGGRWWAGFSKPPKGLAVFVSQGREKVFGGRAERYKKTAALVAGLMRDPGPVKQPPGNKYIVFQRLREIPDNIKIEFVLFFASPTEMASLVTLCYFSHNEDNIIRAPTGSGCQSILSFPMVMQDAPEPDAVMGLWDLFARRSLPQNILTLAIRRWYAEEMAIDIPQSFLAHAAPFTLKGELILLLRRLRKKWKGKDETSKSD